MAQVHNLSDTVLSRLHCSLHDLYLRASRGEVLDFFQDDLVHYVELQLADSLDEAQLVIVRDDEVIHGLDLIPKAVQLQIQLLRGHNVRLHVGDARCTLALWHLYWWRALDVRL